MYDNTAGFCVRTAVVVVRLPSVDVVVVVVVFVVGTTKAGTAPAGLIWSAKAPVKLESVGLIAVYSNPVQFNTTIAASDDAPAKWYNVNTTGCSVASSAAVAEAGSDDDVVELIVVEWAKPLFFYTALRLKELSQRENHLGLSLFVRTRAVVVVGERERVRRD